MAKVFDSMNGELFDEVRTSVNEGKTVPAKLLNRLIFAAVDDARRIIGPMKEQLDAATREIEKIDPIKKKVDKIWPIYQFFAIFGGIAIAAITATAGAVLTYLVIHFLGGG